MSLIKTAVALVAAAVAFAGGAKAADLTPGDGAQFLGLAAIAIAGFSLSARNPKG